MCCRDISAESTSEHHGRRIYFCVIQGLTSVSSEGKSNGKIRKNNGKVCNFHDSGYVCETYEEEVDGTKSCKQGDKANIVIDSGHPSKVILFTKKEKIVFLSVINGIVAIFAIPMIIDSRKAKNVQQ